MGRRKAQLVVKGGVEVFLVYRDMLLKLSFSSDSSLRVVIERCSCLRVQFFSAVYIPPLRFTYPCCYHVPPT